MLGFISGGAIAYGKAVKIGADRKHVVVVAAATDKAIGICQTNDIDAAELSLEIAIPGGGAKAKLGGTVAAGDMLGMDTSGFLVKVATAGDRVIAMAMEDGISGDVIGVEVMAHKAESAQA